MSSEKEDGVCEHKLCNNLDAQCSIIGSNLTQGIESINVNNNNSTISASVCANCGKGEEESHKLKSCTACKLVKYCSRDCQIAHRSQHKKECRKRAAELHEIELFKQPPQIMEDCPICFLLIPTLGTGSSYYACCGKRVCSGCAYAPVFDSQGNIVSGIKKCPFCRIPVPKSYGEMIERYERRIQADDVIAIYGMGCYYRDGVCNGKYEFPQDMNKALKLWHRAAELGNADAYCNIGSTYYRGTGVEVDLKKAYHYYELGAIGGDVYSRNNLGIFERDEGNMDRALKHFLIAVRGGHSESLTEIKQFYSDGYATKEDYTKALQSYQAYLGEIKSAQRDKAAAAREENRYY